MDKVEKALKKLQEKERINIKKMVQKIKTWNIAGLDIKRLKGNNDIYRVRKGNLRIIFKKTNQQITILAIERRSENTYKNF